MSGSTFIDTNVLVYAYSNDDLLKKAQALLALQAADAWLSTQVLIEFANVYARKLKVAWPGVEAALTELAAEFRVHSTTPTTIVKATQLANRYSFVVVRCAHCSSGVGVQLRNIVFGRYATRVANRAKLTGCKPVFALISVLIIFC